MALFTPSSLVTTITFSGTTYEGLVKSMNQWIYGNGINGPTTTGPGVVRPGGSATAKAFQDGVKKSIADLSQDAKTTSLNEQTLETAMNKMADKDLEIKALVDQLDKEIKAMTVDTDKKIATLSSSQQQALASMNNNQKAAMQALTMEGQLELQNLKDNLVPKINALEALHKGATPTIHKITKPLIDRGTPLYNINIQKVAVDGTHILRSVIPYKQNYGVRYGTEDPKTKSETEHIIQSVDNADLHIFNEGGYLAIQPKKGPTDVTTAQVGPPSQPPLPSTGHTK